MAVFMGSSAFDSWSDGKSNVLAGRWGKRKYLDDGGTRGCMDPYGVVAASARLGGRGWGPVDSVADFGAGRLVGRRWAGPPAVSCSGDGVAIA